MEGKIRKYSNDDITVVWKPEICMHAGECVKGSPEVFKPKENPWVKVDNASAEELKATIDKCPSGALSYETADSKNDSNAKSAAKIKFFQNGPIMVEGNFDLTDSDGNRIEAGEKAVLCRCGGSASKPFCDGIHKKIGFQE